jgi:predicted TIM-barrel fold metal-dependent hydrolase
MHTDWGDIRVSDAHVHFFSHGFFSALAAQRKSTYEELQPVLGWQLPSEDPAELADRWVVELDQFGLSRAALIASVPGDEGSVAAAVTRHPDRFYGFFMINPTQRSPETHVASALAGGVLQGICLFPAMHHFSVHDTRLMPLYEIAAAHPGTVVFVHCGALSVGVRKKLGLQSHFDMRFSNPLDLHAIAMQFPKLNFVVPHFGGGYFREALMLCDLCPNVYLDTSSSNSWMRYEGLDLKTVFQRARQVCGAGRLLFGTDSSFFPRGWNAAVYQLQSEVLADLGVSREEAEQIFCSNLERLLSRTPVP